MGERYLLDTSELLRPTQRKLHSLGRDSRAEDDDAAHRGVRACPARRAGHGRERLEPSGADAAAGREEDAGGPANGGGTASLVGSDVEGGAIPISRDRTERGAGTDSTGTCSVQSIPDASATPTPRS